jgi:bifunctional DNase/RNase
MPQMRIFKVLQTTIRFSRTTIFLLLDEQQQRLLALQGWEQVPSVPLQATAARGVVPAEPLTSDFLASVLHALGGVLEEIAIDILPNEHLSARLHLRDQRGLHSVNANLNDAFRLAHPEQSTTSWTSSTLDWHVPAEQDIGFIIFGVSLQGGGQIWIRDVHLQTVEVS